jgi:hypothetical protein
VTARVYLAQPRMHIQECVIVEYGLFRNRVRAVPRSPVLLQAHVFTGMVP